MPMVMQKMEGLTRKGYNLNPHEEDYPSIVGLLRYLIIGTRPNLTSSVGIVSRYLSNPSKEHLAAAKCIQHYVKGTKNYTLMLGPSKNRFELYGYADVD